MKITREQYNRLNGVLDGLEKIANGGKGSGNFGHKGRPGEVGGSGDGTGITTTETSSSRDYSKMKIDELKAELERRGIESLKSDKSSLIYHLEKDDEFQKNVDDSQREVDKLGLSDEEKARLNSRSNGFRDTEVVLDNNIEKDEEGEIVSGERTYYGRQGNGILYQRQYALGKQAGNLNSSLVQPLEIVKSNNLAKSKGLELRSQYVNRAFVNGKWEDTSYGEKYASWTGSVNQALKALKVGESQLISEIGVGISKDVYGKRSARVELDRSTMYGRYQGKVGTNNSRDFAEASISRMSDDKHYGVNWGAWGTQDASTTKIFASNLDRASTAANYLESTVLELRKIWRDNEDRD